MRKRPKKQIYTEEYVLINGIEQFLLHGGTDYDNPVLLFLHGGPGSSESLFAHSMQTDWENLFTVVHWDQRGAGKTYTRNPGCLPAVEDMMKDLYEVIQYLKKKYGKEKIAILGHSWGSVLGSSFILKYPQEVSFYIGVGQVVSMRENERVGYEKLKEQIVEAKDSRALKILDEVGDYPGEKLVMDGEFMKKCSRIRRLQGKYKLSVDLGLSLWITALKSPIFKLSDIKALFKAFETNKKILEDFLGDFDLNRESAGYEVPVYYILGGNDWQTPYVIAQKYFEKIQAPNKKFFLVPDAGHFTMFDQPKLFFKALSEVYNIEKEA